MEGGKNRGRKEGEWGRKGEVKTGKRKEVRSEREEDKKSMPACCHS